MAYFDISRLRQDTEFLDRVAACYSVETPLGEASEDPIVWATQHAWDVASAPGFGDAYGYAIAAGNEHPGSDPSVIDDAQILAAVQVLINNEGVS